jgi:hypothetical protein
VFEYFKILLNTWSHAGLQKLESNLWLFSLTTRKIFLHFPKLNILLFTSSKTSESCF